MLGCVRDVCKKVPPVRSIVRMTWSVSSTTYWSWELGSSGSNISGPLQPRRKPITRQPWSMARLTTCLIHGFRPGTSPPPVSTAKVFCLVINLLYDARHMIQNGPFCENCANVQPTSFHGPWCHPLAGWATETSTSFYQRAGERASHRHDPERNSPQPHKWAGGRWEEIWDRAQLGWLAR